MENVTNGKNGLIQNAADDASLAEVNGSIVPPKNGSFWRKLWAFSGHITTCYCQLC